MTRTTITTRGVITVGAAIAYAIRLALLIGFCAVIGALCGSALVGLAVGLGLALLAQLA